MRVALMAGVWVLLLGLGLAPARAEDGVPETKAFLEFAKALDEVYRAQLPRGMRYEARLTDAAKRRTERRVRVADNRSHRVVRMFKRASVDGESDRIGDGLRVGLIDTNSTLFSQSGYRSIRIIQTRCTLGKQETPDGLLRRAVPGRCGRLIRPCGRFLPFAGRVAGPIGQLLLLSKDPLTQPQQETGQRATLGRFVLEHRRRRYRLAPTAQTQQEHPIGSRQSGHVIVTRCLREQGGVDTTERLDAANAHQSA